ncbi:4-hydroxy-tetrahydrodipicolinate reductase [Candidatus Binatia bacterium]|nr:4-hydroxy-tetrahydrodipicolinate reductase [Candidatus Binatia bacterium]
MPTRMIVCGAAGRMGRMLVTLIAQNPAAVLAGAIEVPGHGSLGADAGTLAGVAPQHVAIADRLAAAAGPDTVILDFTNAEAALANLRTAVDCGSAMVIGSTGFSAAQQSEIDALAPRIRSVVAANMSVGITVLHRLIQAAATTLGPDFDAEIVEMHHRLKVDAPSGTALALARTLAAASGLTFPDDIVSARAGVIGKRTDREIGVMALRGGDVVGDHTVIFAGSGERIELTHRAHSRECLARGAVRAALWIAGQPVGRYGMADVLGL